ncbi:DUF1508 domain-containing protein [uncultured Arthrobacter sp.]|uniref:YegP family protein n=1 Tax=uncultured Arthrobacter sp. TaxID=114050 RepID=UPI0026075BC2|nr:DUF1508 domain-containing protein [uncultured Arthrobacter sp.]
MAGKFVLYFDDSRNYRFRLTGDDGATLMTSEPYDNKATAVSGINGIRDCASTALISDQTDGDQTE